MKLRSCRALRPTRKKKNEKSARAKRQTHGRSHKYRLELTEVCLTDSLRRVPSGRQYSKTRTLVVRFPRAQRKRIEFAVTQR